MVVVAVVEIRSLGRDLDEVGAIPGAAQRDGRLLEQHVDIGRDVRLARPALLRLLDKADNRRVARGEIFLGAGERRAGKASAR